MGIDPNWSPATKPATDNITGCNILLFLFIIWGKNIQIHEGGKLLIP